MIGVVLLIVFGVAVTGILVEAFVPRRLRYLAQGTLALGGLIAAFVAVIELARDNKKNPEMPIWLENAPPSS